jgi:predicted metal-dependent hydrolase
MQFELPFSPRRSGPPAETAVRVGGQAVRLRFCRHRRARRYVLRLCPDGAARVTIPRGGTQAEAARFVQRNAAWLQRQLLRQAAQPVRSNTWLPGTEILFRGEPTRLDLDPSGQGLRLGGEVLAIPCTTGDLRPAVERYLREIATGELSPRVAELAALHHFPVRRVTVRNQRSRWGSCSRRGTISLNWRLVQTPVFVRDYIILHELAHLKEMNHSRRFWNEVARICPEFEQAERWLKKHSKLLL